MYGDTTIRCFRYDFAFYGQNGLIEKRCFYENTVEEYYFTVIRIVLHDNNTTRMRIPSDQMLILTKRVIHIYI